MLFVRRGLVKKRMFYKELLPASECIVLFIERLNSRVQTILCFLSFLSDLELKLKVMLPCDKLIAAISDVQNCDLLGRIRLVKFNNISLNIIQ